jgi:hypothetical protein
MDYSEEREAQTFAKRLAAKLAEKWLKPNSQVAGYVKARLSIAAAAEFQRTISGPDFLNGKTELV